VGSAPKGVESEDTDVLGVRIVLGLGLIVKIAAATDAVVFTTRFGTVEFVQSGVRDGSETSDFIELATKPVDRATPLWCMEDGRGLAPDVKFHAPSPEVLLEEL
jgi:hypothetical protein